MKKSQLFVWVLIFFVFVSIACDMSSGGDTFLEETQIALSVHQTSMAQGQSPQADQPQPSVARLAASLRSRFPLVKIHSEETMSGT